MTTTTRVVPVRDDLLRAFTAVRSTTESLYAPLATEDMVVQSMPDVSPTKWHLAHVTWFFETLVLGSQRDTRYRALRHGAIPAIFNSYYQSLGDRLPARHGAGTFRDPR